MSTITVPTRPVARWLTEVLGGDALLQSLAPGGVHYGRVPRPTSTSTEQWPAVVFALLSGLDVRPQGHEYVWADCIYVVKGIDKQANFARVEGVAQQLSTLLDNASGTPPGGQVFACQRLYPIEQLEDTTGMESFVHLGGAFHIQAR